MTTDYDKITGEYQQSKLQPWRTHIEAHCLLGMAGDVTGRSVVDLACGEGYYTRRLRTLGAAHVLGIDLSAGMIELARAQEQARPLGIEYRVGDAAALDLAGEHDLVVAAYLLNYAKDEPQVTAMCCGIAAALRPGGRFVTVNSATELDFAQAPSFRKYGFETTVRSPQVAGAPVEWKFYLDDRTFALENYYLDRPTHERVLHAAGFSQVRWHRPRVSDQGLTEFGADYWADFLGHPPISLIECVK